MVASNPPKQEEDATQVCRTSAQKSAGKRQPSQLRGIVMRTHANNQPSQRLAQVRDQESQREILNFLHALRTYPDRFAQEPQLSFEQHFFQVAAELPEVSGKAADGIQPCKV